MTPNRHPCDRADGRAREALCGSAIKRIAATLTAGLAAAFVIAAGAGDAAGHGAIAYDSRTGAVGWVHSLHAATDGESRALAERTAVERCGAKGCTARLWVDGSCGALTADREDATKIGKSWNWSTRPAAEAEALRQCGDNCAVMAWVCDTRP